MQWQDQGVVLGGRRFGESGLILDVLTAKHGRRSGLVYGGASRKKRVQFEPGNVIELAWSGRLENQLGRFDTAEAETLHAAQHLDNATALLAISSLAEILRQALDEGDDAGSAVYGPSLIVLEALSTEAIWPALYARWELGLLAALGFGLDLDQCALSGETTGLTHVSPNTGRAVQAEEAGDFVDRLFPLPAFLHRPESGAPSQDDILDGLTLTGHFLEQRLFAALHRGVPPVRARLVQRIAKTFNGRS
ncbi:MAG: DNA repair protein RecO [Pseudomonadota bacterium]